MNKEIEEMSKIFCKECSKYKKKCIGGQCNIQCVMAEFFAEALINAGYRKQEIKTNGDRIRYIKSTLSDEVMAEDMIKLLRSFGRDDYKALFVNDIFDTHEEAYQANLEWLKQEYKGE